MSTIYQMIAPCHFGLESILAGELKRLHAQDICACDGQVSFSGDASIVARANLCLRTAERVLIQLGSFTATSFTELFDGVRNLPIEEFVGKNDCFPVKGWSLKSALHSVPDCQAIIKKAMVERMKAYHRQDWFSETGATYQVRFFILKDQATITLDTSGVGLHKRGYRTQSNIAPIKETLAAGIVDLARVRGGSQVCDPVCGSGTFLIEAATKALNIPPGIRRKFAAQKWGSFPQEIWAQERTRGLELIRHDAQFHATGFDCDPASIALTSDNAKRAGVGNKLTLKVQHIHEFKADEGVTTLANPPYGTRMLEKKQAEEIYKTMGKVFVPMNQSNYCVICAHDHFERLFGRQAQKRRKLYNGMIRCQVYQYFNQV